MTRPVLRLAPAIRATAVVAMALGLFLALIAIGRAAGGADGAGGAYAVWATAVTVSILAWASVFVSGITRLRRLEPPWKPTASWLTIAALLYAVLAVAASAFLLLLTAQMGSLGGSDATRGIVRFLMIVGWIAAAPWLFLLWITDQRARVLRREVRAVPSGSSVLRPVVELDEIWSAIERSSLALGLMLSTLVINTALMRNIMIADGTSAEAVPAWTVVGYGIFFAIVLAAILLPVVIGWRDAGFAVVRQAVPDTPSGIPSEESASERERLLTRVGVERAFVRRPIAILGVLAPFLTGFFSTLIPTD